jgi:uracil-DNA glycosylase
MSSATIDLSQIQTKMIQKLNASGWNMLEPFIRSAGMKNILSALVQDSEQGHKMTPPLKDILRPFELCSYTNLRVVMIGLDPYIQEGAADGLMFSCGKTAKHSKTLKHILNEVNRTVYPHLTDYEMDNDPNLARWAQQGVLLLNSALTTRVGQTAAHAEIWYPFIENFIRQLTHNKNGVMYCFVGKRARQLEQLIDTTINPVIKLEHPLITIAKGEKWDCKNLFNRVNQHIYDFDGSEIQW